MFVTHNIRAGCPGTRWGMSWHQKTKMADDCYEALYSPILVMHCVCKNGISPSVVHLQFYVNSSLHHSVTTEQFKKKSLLLKKVNI